MLKVLQIGLKLNDWSKDAYFSKREVCDRYLSGEMPGFKDTIERIQVDQVSEEEFQRIYE